MKLPKSYSFKKSKSDEIISFTFPFIDASRKFEEKKDSIRNHLLPFESFRFWLRIRGDIGNRKMTPDSASFATLRLFDSDI